MRARRAALRHSCLLALAVAAAALGGRSAGPACARSLGSRATSGGLARQQPNRPISATDTHTTAHHPCKMSQLGMSTLHEFPFTASSPGSPTTPKETAFSSPAGSPLASRVGLHGSRSGSVFGQDKEAALARHELDQKGFAQKREMYVLFLSEMRGTARGCGWMLVR